MARGGSLPDGESADPAPNRTTRMRGGCLDSTLGGDLCRSCVLYAVWAFAWKSAWARRECPCHASDSAVAVDSSSGNQAWEGMVQPCIAVDTPLQHNSQEANALWRLGDDFPLTTGRNRASFPGRWGGGRDLVGLG